MLIMKQFTEEGGGSVSTYLDGQHVTEFLTMFDYEWYCITMCTSIIILLNLPTEYKGID